MALQMPSPSLAPAAASTNEPQRMPQGGGSYEAPLPNGWLKEWDPQYRQFYFVNTLQTPPHITWEDPRLNPSLPFSAPAYNATVAPSAAATSNGPPGDRGLMTTAMGVLANKQDGKLGLGGKNQQQQQQYGGSPHGVPRPHQGQVYGGSNISYGAPPPQGQGYEGNNIPYGAPPQGQGYGGSSYPYGASPAAGGAAASFYGGGGQPYTQQSYGPNHAAPPPSSSGLGGLGSIAGKLTGDGAGKVNPLMAAAGGAAVAMVAGKLLGGHHHGHHGGLAGELLGGGMGGHHHGHHHGHHPGRF